MKIFIFGIKGNMGRRYSAILKYLGYDYDGIDLEDIYDSNRALRHFDRFIIATPTLTHLDFLDSMIDFRKPVLCEKPIITDSRLNRLEHFVKAAKDSEMKLSMVSQYDHLVVGNKGNSETYYNYFKTGNDGLAWDCINIIWHADGKIHLANDSPVWKCEINGLRLTIDQMDFAYIKMIEKWIEEPYLPQYDRILKSHQKVLDYLDGKFH